MVGVEIHTDECPEGGGAKTRLKLLKRSAIYAHCEGVTGPREP
jgi:hypothetical protein